MEHAGGRQRRVLLVDDDPTIAWFLGKYLTRQGLSVATSGDGAEAIELLKRERYDALVTDLQMPRLNGLALLEWAHQHRPSLLVVAITGFGSPSVQELALRRGAVLYLEKPVDPALLFEVLKLPERSREAFSGTIHRIELIEYIQLLLLSRKRAVLEVSGRRGEQVYLFIDQGHIVHAKLGTTTGEEAFYRCLELEGGLFTTTPWREPSRRTIETPGDFLLMEAARLRDEAGRSAVEPEEPLDLSDFCLRVEKTGRPE